jgi:hypothetical protein
MQKPRDVGSAGLSEGRETSHKWLGAAVRGQVITAGAPMAEAEGIRLVGDGCWQ